MIREINDFHDSLVRERRYALLQAAATILADSFYLTVHNEPAYWMDTKLSVNEAEALLAEIEKRENAEAQS